MSSGRGWRRGRRQVRRRGPGGPGAVEELLFELGDVLTESADFVDSGKACVAEDLARPVAFRCVSRRFQRGARFLAQPACRYLE